MKVIFEKFQLCGVANGHMEVSLPHMQYNEEPSPCQYTQVAPKTSTNMTEKTYVIK